MRISFVLVIALAFTAVPACKKEARRETAEAPAPAPAPAPASLAASERTVEAGCATCIFDMEGVTGCKLAVKIDGKAYLVTGSEIDDHGDAHDATGLCNSSREALVVGEIEGDRFTATSFKLKP